MPSLKFIARPERSRRVHRSSFIANKLSLVTCLPAKALAAAGFLSLIIFLSGCSAIGSQKFAALQVTSTPEASIFLDGKLLGKSPFYSDNLKSGTYNLKITTSDATYEDKLDLSESTLTVVDRDLAANFLAQAGQILSLVPHLKGLAIVSLPTDADVTIDGRYFGKTPIKITDIAAGEHKVSISKISYVEREFAIKTLPRYQLVAQVTLASKVAKGIPRDVSQPESSSSAKIEILKTVQNFVKVKKEPDTLSADIGRAKTGEQLNLIGQSQSWFQIIFEGKQGWIPEESAKQI